MNTATLPPISPQLATRCALALLAAMVLASAVGALALGPVAAAADAHRLTDPRTPFGLTNGWSVLLQAPLLLAALGGALGAGRWLPDAVLSRAWTAFFVLVLFATLASVADHLAPSANGYMLSQLPGGSACALLIAIFLAERVSLSWIGPMAFKLAVASGPIGGLLWFMSQALGGEPDYRLLLWLEHLPLLLPLSMWSLPSRGVASGHWIVALLCFAVAGLIDWADLAIWQASAGAIGGHALHHLALAACLCSLAWSIAHQPAAREAGMPASRQRDTSFTTSG